LVSSDISGSIFLLAVMLVLSVYFSATETSITATGKGKLRALSEEYPYRKKAFLWLANNTAKAINVTLIGNNLVNIAASAVATSVAIKLFGSLGPVLAVVIMSVLIIVFCEILPKNVAIVKRESILLLGLPLLRFFSFIMSPLTWLLLVTLKCVGRLVGMDLVSYSSLVSREEIEQIVAEGSAVGALEEDERRMIHSVITFEEKRVYEVMEPRMDISAIEESGTAEEAVNIFIQSGHSRIPVYKEDLDNIIGILYAKDLLGPLLAGDKKISILKLMRSPLFVPETMKTDEALDMMKKYKTHLAIVVDEYGGTAGLITLEDLIEEIVGDIQDEYDTEIPEIMKESEDTYLVQGQVSIAELSEALDYPFDEAFEDVDTLAGMVLELSGDFPKQDQVISYGAWDIHVLEVRKHRIMQVRMKYIKEREQEPLSD